MKRLIQHPIMIRLLHWEYWPFHVVYAVIYVYWIWLMLKSRSFFFFSAANPRIENGGFMMESKKSIYDLMPGHSYPRTLLFPDESPSGGVQAAIMEAGFQFPLIAKPDIGLRGIGVQKINDTNDLEHYASQSRVPFLVQEFIPYEMEAGIFYYRYPDQQRGHISGIVSKEFLAVTGDGHKTMLELLQQDPRFILQLKSLRKEFADEMPLVLAEGEKRLLVPYGNHARGAKFIDASHMIDADLEQVIDNICRQVDGFYYGRMDIRFTNWDDLRAGKNFSIVELNGAGSEPTHIYDPRHSLVFAWREIIRHLDILYAISKQNRQQSPYMKFWCGVKMLRANAAYLKLLGE